MNKYLVFLTVTLSVLHISAYSNEYLLKVESHPFVINSVIGGAIVGGGLGLIAALIKQRNSSKPKNTWEKVKLFPWHYVILPALAGAASAGYVASHFSKHEHELMVKVGDSLRFECDKNNQIEYRYHLPLQLNDKYYGGDIEGKCEWVFHATKPGIAKINFENYPLGLYINVRSNNSYTIHIERDTL